MSINQTAIIYMLSGILCVSAAHATADGGFSEQLRINRSALTSSPDDSIREVAAKQLLLDSDPAAKDILVDILKDHKNLKAIEAVCKAIGSSEQWDTSITYHTDYIEPLVEIIRVGEASLAKTAADALIIYPYTEIKGEIEKLLFDEKSEQQTRLNAVYAVGLRLSDKEAIAEIITLLDDKDPLVAEQAGKTLQAWVPMGSNKDLWNYVRSELKQKNPDEILRNRLASQEQRVQMLARENSLLAGEIVNVYDQLYQTKADADARSAFLVEALKKDFAQVRLWAIGRVASWRNSSDLPAELKGAVVAVIGDTDAQVRLEAAKLVIYMADANPSQRLMAQLKIEKDPAVELALLEALGESCYYALLPSSGLELDKEIRIFTLDKANEFLTHGSADRVVAAAEVTRKLLEKNGIDDEDAEKYIAKVNNRYKEALSKTPPLAARLLEVLNRFCQQGFHYRAIARKILEPEFMAVVSTSSDAATRRAAAQGLIYIDRTAALKIFTDKQLYNDPEPSLTAMVINLAKDVGGGKDYAWLAEKAKQKTEGAWQAIIAILQREDVAVVEQAVEAIDSFDVSDARKIEVFEIGRKKAGIQYKSTGALARFHIKRDNYNEASQLYEWLLADAAGKSEAIRDADNAIEAFIKANKEESIVKIVEAVLAAEDILPESNIGVKLTAAVENRKNPLKESLAKIALPQDKPRDGWKKLIQSWSAAAEAKQPPPAEPPAQEPQEQQSE